MTLIKISVLHLSDTAKFEEEVLVLINISEIGYILSDLEYVSSLLYSPTSDKNVSCIHYTSIHYISMNVITVIFMYVLCCPLDLCILLFNKNTSNVFYMS